MVIELALRLGVVITKGSITKEPTTIKLAKPVLLGFAAELTLYCPAFTRPEALVVVASGINAVVSCPPPATPSLRVNAVASIGGSPHLALESMKATYGLDIVHVPYKGSAPALQDLIGGQISMMFDNLPAALQLINGGQVRALGVTTLKRTASAPEIPTLDESGMKGFDSQGWFALLAPAGTPAPILDRINVEANRIISTPEFRERMTKVGADTVGGSIDEFRARIKSETERWGKVIEAANIKAE